MQPPLKIINFVYIGGSLKHIKILICNACYNSVIKICKSVDKVLCAYYNNIIK